MIGSNRTPSERITFVGLSRCLAFALCSLVSPSAWGQPGNPVTLPSAIGNGDPYTWTDRSPADQAIAKELCSISDAVLVSLLESDDPVCCGAGLFVLDARGDLPRMLDHLHFLDDPRQSLPRATYSDDPTASWSEPTTLREHAGIVFEKWLGWRPGSAAEAEAALAGIENPDLLAYVWLARLKQAQGIEGARAYEARGMSIPPPPSVPAVLPYDTTASVKAGINTLPPSTRWVVVALIVHKGSIAYTEQEASAAFTAAATELGGHISPDASPAWLQPGLTPDKFPHQKEAAIATLQYLAPTLIAP